MDIKGHIVKKVMIAQAAPIESEYYLAILLDRAGRWWWEKDGNNECGLHIEHK